MNDDYNNDFISFEYLVDLEDDYFNYDKKLDCCSRSDGPDNFYCSFCPARFDCLGYEY